MFFTYAGCKAIAVPSHLSLYLSQKVALWLFSASGNEPGLSVSYTTRETHVYKSHNPYQGRYELDEDETGIYYRK
jgi:hypothetical protein